MRMGMMALMAVLPTGLGAQPVTHAALDWQQPWHVPTVAATGLRDEAALDEYAWRLFVAVNWPAAADGGADSGRLLGEGPLVWEHWCSQRQIFRADGADPGARCPRQDDDSRSRFNTPAAAGAPSRRVVHGALQDFDPIADADHLTEVHFNDAAFDYIRAADLYNLDGQLRHWRAGETLRFPRDSIQVKALWRPADTAQCQRHYCIESTLGTQRRRYALLALHIVSRALPGWVWITFEHIDNAQSTAHGAGWMLPSRDRFACEGAADCNAAPRRIGLEGTVWQYYRLRGVMTQYLNAGEPALLANSQLEAGVQHSSACMTCHARATVAEVDQRAAHLPVLDDAEPPEHGDASRGYVGVPDPRWYQQGGVHWMLLDSVWSLAVAQPRRPF